MGTNQNARIIHNSYLQLTASPTLNCKGNMGVYGACKQKKPVKLLGTVVRRLISANQELNYDLDFFIPLFKSLSWIIFSLLRRTFNHQIVDERNCIGLSFKAFTSKIRFPTNPELS